MPDRMLLFGGESKILANGTKFKMAFHIASSTTVNGDQFFCCEPCRSEHVFKGSGKLFNDAMPYRFVPVFGTRTGHAFRIGKLNKGKASRSTVRDGSFMGGSTSLLKYGNYRPLVDDFILAVKAANTGKTLVARTVVSGHDSVASIIDYPCKTLNFFPNSNLIQADTGPIAVFYNGSMRLAYIAFFRANEVNLIMDDGLSDTVDFRESVLLQATNTFYVKE